MNFAIISKKNNIVVGHIKYVSTNNLIRMNITLGNKDLFAKKIVAYLLSELEPRYSIKNITQKRGCATTFTLGHYYLQKKRTKKR